jgi:outer membrane biosynthesis protein TonB
MPTAPPSLNVKSLRIGLIQGGKCTEDRTFAKRASVTIGQDSKNTFVVPLSNLPAAFTLFELVNNQYGLVFRKEMDGEITVNGKKLSLQQAVSQGMAKQRSDGYLLPLNESILGKVVLGEVTVLFQFVTPPKEAARVELPKEIRGTFFSQIDQFFFAILMASMFFHFSGATFIACQPAPVERELALDEFKERFVAVAIPPEIKKPEKKDETKPGDDKKDDSKKPKADNKGDKATTPTPSKDLAKAVASKGLLKIIGASGAGGGAIDDVLGSSNGVGDIASALSGASGIGVATADSLSAGGQKGGTAGSAAGIGDLGTSGGGKTDLGEKGNTVIRGRVTEASPDVESGQVDREKLMAYVRQRRSAIVNCYEKELKRNPSLKGKVVVRFSITPAGRTSEIEIEENTLGNEAVSSCIRTVIRGWVFPFKPDGETSVAFPFVFAPTS